MESDWQKAGIGPVALREQLAALGRGVKPLRGAISALAGRSAELQAAVHAEGIQRNMGRARQGIKRLGFLGQAGLLVGEEESTKKYRYESIPVSHSVCSACTVSRERRRDGPQDW